MSFVQYAKRKEKEESWAEDNESHGHLLSDRSVYMYTLLGRGWFKKETSRMHTTKYTTGGLLPLFMHNRPGREKKKKIKQNKNALKRNLAGILLACNKNG